MAAFADTGVSYVISARDVSKAAVDSAVSGSKRVGSATERMAAQTKLHLANMQKYWLAAKVAVAAAVAAISGAVAASVGKYAEFEKEMANVSTLVDTNRVSMAGLQKQILSLNPNLGSATELTKGLYQALSAGVDPARAVELVGLAAQAAKAGLSDTFTAVDAGTTILNAFGMEVGKASEVYDLMFTTVKEGKTTFEELAAAEAKISPIAAAANVSIYEQHAALATLTKGGFKTAEASARLATALGAIIKPSSDAVKTAEELGLKFDAQALKAQGLHGFLQSVKEATGGNIEEMAKLFGGMESLSVMLALTGKQSQEFTNILGRMKNTSGATEEAFNKQKQTLSALWETTKNTFTREAILLGEMLAPKIKEVLEKTTAWIEANRELIAQKTEEYFNNLVSAAGHVKNAVYGISSAAYAAAAGMLQLYAVYLRLESVDVFFRSKLALTKEARDNNKAILDQILSDIEAANKAAIALAEKSQIPFLGPENTVAGAEAEAAKLLDLEKEKLARNAEYYQLDVDAHYEAQEKKRDAARQAQERAMELQEETLARNAEYYQFDLDAYYEATEGALETEAMKMARQAAYYDVDVQLMEKHLQKTKEYAQKEARAKAEGYKNMMSNAAYFFNWMGEQSLVAWRIYQGIEIAQTMAATIEAAQAAYAWGMKYGGPSGPALAVAAAAAAVAAGVARVAQIAALTPESAGATGVYSADSLTGLPTTETSGSNESTGEISETKERSIIVQYNNYGYTYADPDQLARDLVPSIRKAIDDGV